jgi:predicted phage baseplate assembly protein
VTRITLDRALPASTFGIRKTIALVQSEKLSLAEVPIPTVSGYKLALDGVYPDLAKGRRLLVKGTLAGGDESIDLLQVDSVDSQAGYATVTLHSSLAEYNVAGLTIYGNVALGGHGETVPDEPLGSGDASAAFQTFTLGKSPVSFVPRAGASHGAANTLDLRVDRVQWSEVATFYGTGGNDPVYTTEEDELGRMTVRFGDGRTGARLPTGRNNVAASYRRGIGMVGNVRAGSLTTLLDRPVGLSAAINPDQAGGGADAEKVDTARANAPNTVRTFGRIVSLQDFEDAAREFAGIEKAHATVATTPLGEEEVRLTVAGFSKQVPDKSTRELLRADLDSRRDRNQRLLVQAGIPVAITIKVGVHSAADRIPADVQAAVRAALLDQFSWDKVDFGQAIRESGVYRVVQAVPGVVAAHIELLDTIPSRGLKTSIAMGDTELPELKDGDLHVVDWQPEMA